MNCNVRKFAVGFAADQNWKMEKEVVLEKFEQLRVWQNAGERAPHKPLLVLYAIGKLLRDGNRLVPYSEIDENLGNLLREFGPRQVHYGTQYPFLRLQNDQIWEVSDADRIRQTASGDALKSDLVRYEVTGGFPEEISHQLQNDSKLAFEIVQSLLDAHFPSSFHEDILQTVGIEHPLRISTRQRRDPNFRANILKAYEYKCAICGFDVKLRHQPVALEASHIKWRQANGPDTEANGLALCSLHHKLFDRGAFTLSHQLEILVSDDAHGSVGFQEWLMKFHGKEINFPQRKLYYPKADYTGWHTKEVFKGDNREL